MPRACIGVLCLVVGSGLLAGSARADGPPEIHDKDYCILLIQPGADWRLLVQSQSEQVTPDSIAGAQHKLGATCGISVIADQPGGLEAFARSVFKARGERDMKLEFAKDLEYLDKKAVRIQYTSVVNGLRVRREETYFRHQAYIFVITGHGLEAAIKRDGSSFEPFHDAIELTEGTVRPRAARPPADQNGVGWRVEGGVYRSLVSGLRIAPPGAWRLLVAEELQALNPAAEVGCLHTTTGSFIAIESELVGHQDPETYRREVAQRLAEQLQSRPRAETRMAQVANQTLRFSLIPVPGADGAENALSVLRSGRRMVLLRAGYDTAKAEAAWRAIQEAFHGLRILVPEERDALREELDALPHPQSAIGPQMSLRGGAWQDFARGLKWRPASAGWKVTVGDAVRAVNEDALLLVQHMERDVFGMLSIVKKPPEVTADRVHTFVAGQVFGQNTVARLGAPQATPLGNLQGLRTSGRTRDQGVPMYFHLFTAIWKDQIVQFNVWGSVFAMRNAGAIVAEAVRGLRFHANPLKARESGPHHVIDRRVGYEYRAPDATWRVQDVTPEAIASMGSVLAVRGVRGKGNVLAVTGIARGKKPLQIERIVLNMIMAGMRSRLSLDEEPVREQVRLAGATAQRTRWALQDGGHIDFAVIMRGPSILALLLLVPKGGGGVQLQEFASGLKLLD